MYKLFTIDNSKKSDIKGFWQDKNKVYIDNVFIRDCQNSKDLRQGIKELFNKKELAIFYIKNNKGYILDNKGNKTRLNNRIIKYRHYLSIYEIKKLLNKYNGLTIYRKIDDLTKEKYFVIEIFHNIEFIKAKRIKKQKELITKLFNSYIEKLNIKTLPIKIRFKLNGYSSKSKSRFKYNNDKMDFELVNHVIICLNSLKVRVKKGYSSDYYNDRDKKLSFAKGNRHLIIRFILLHELKHSIDYLNDFADYKDNIISKKEIESKADNFAIEKLKEFGDLKNEKL